MSTNTITLHPKSITESKKDIFIFFHICCIGNYIEVTNEIIDSIIESGLYEKCKKIYYSIVSTPNDSLVSRLHSLDKFEMVYSANHIDNMEYPILIKLQEFCQTTDCYVMYLHTKGVSSKFDKFKHMWRKRLLQKVVKEHEVCISMLNEGFDIAGCGWKQNVKGEQKSYVSGTSEHFSGNFWWANSKHILRLPSLETIQNKCKGNVSKLEYRVQCEYWIGFYYYMNVGVNGELNKEYSSYDFYTPALPKIIYTDENGISPDGWILTRYKCPKTIDKVVKVKDIQDNEHIGTYNEETDRWCIPRENGISIIKGEIVSWKKI